MNKSRWKARLLPFFESTFFAALFAAGLLGAGCHRSEPAPEETARKEANHRWEEAVKTFGDKYGAKTNWESTLPERGPLSGPFTIDLSRSLVTTNGVLFIMELADLSESRDGFRLHFTSPFGYRDGHHNMFQLDLDLLCSAQLAGKVERMKSGRGFAEHAVVARISQVSRARIEVRGTGERDNSLVDIDYYPPLFFAKGECLDVLEKESVEQSAQGLAQSKNVR